MVHPVGLSYGIISFTRVHDARGLGQHSIDIIATEVHMVEGRLLDDAQPMTDFLTSYASPLALCFA